jgi:hypothetical protein
MTAESPSQLFLAEDSGLGEKRMRRKSPIRHRVRAHHRVNAHVDSYVRGHGQRAQRGVVQQSYPGKVVKMKLIDVNLDELVPSDHVKPQFEERVKYFIDLYKNGHTIPPIMVHKLPNGKYQILDGHARAEAFRRLGFKKIIAADNSIAGAIGSAAGQIVGGVIEAGGHFVGATAKGVQAGVAGARTQYAKGAPERARLKAAREYSKEEEAYIREQANVAHEQRIMELQRRASKGDVAAQRILAKLPKKALRS